MLITPIAMVNLLGFFGGWELILIVSVVLVLFGVRKLPGLWDGYHRGIDEIKKAADEVTQEIRRTVDPDPENPAPSRTSNDDLFLWLAQGFDVGRIPFAPGTFGTILGLLWFAILLVPASPVVYLVGMGFGFGASIWLCGEAERILNQRDPGSVVLDEITAVPVCFVPWVAIEYFRHHSMPSVETFFTGQGLLLTAILFGLFRIFDITKPWLIRKSQFLPGGLGVTVDDFLAAAFVAGISLLFVA